MGGSFKLVSTYFKEVKLQIPSYYFYNRKKQITNYEKQEFLYKSNF